MYIAYKRNSRRIAPLREQYTGCLYITKNDNDALSAYNFLHRRFIFGNHLNKIHARGQRT